MNELNELELNELDPNELEPEQTRYYWSGSGFLISGINEIPEEAVEITEEEWHALLFAQSEGKKIQTGPEGKPVAVIPEKIVTVDDYDRAMEAHLLAERSARGYTTREPSDYKDSAVPRWAQDAEDWIAHRDAVMLYGLEVMDHYAETGEAPTLEEFKAALPVIVWSFE